MANPQQKSTQKHDDALKEDLQKAQLQEPSGAVRGQSEAHGTHDGEPPILIGREGDTFRTVTLSGGGSGSGQYRVAEPLPLTLIAAGSRYMRSTEDTYVWQHP